MNAGRDRIEWNKLGVGPFECVGFDLPSVAIGDVKHGTMFPEKSTVTVGRNLTGHGNMGARSHGPPAVPSQALGRATQSVGGKELVVYPPQMINAAVDVGLPAPSTPIVIRGKQPGPGPNR